MYFKTDVRLWVKRHSSSFPGEMQTGNLPVYVEDDILVTHIRGEVPPHITPEYDFPSLQLGPLLTW